MCCHSVPPLHRGPAIMLQQKTSGFRVVESSPDPDDASTMQTFMWAGKMLQCRLEIPPHLIREFWGSLYIELA